MLIEIYSSSKDIRTKSYKISQKSEKIHTETCRSVLKVQKGYRQDYAKACRSSKEYIQKLYRFFENEKIQVVTATKV